MYTSSFTSKIVKLISALPLCFFNFGLPLWGTLRCGRNVVPTLVICIICSSVYLLTFGLLRIQLHDTLLFSSFFAIACGIVYLGILLILNAMHIPTFLLAIVFYESMVSMISLSAFQITRGFLDKRKTGR